MKSFRKLILLLLLGLAVLALPACRKGAGLPEQVASVLKIKINPEISIFLDAEGRILSIQPENADGQQVLDAIDGDWASGVLSEVVQKIVETSVSEGFLKEGGEVSLQFYGDAEALSAVQQTVDEALEQAQQEAPVSFTVKDPKAVPIGNYRGETPDYDFFEGYASWDSTERDANGLLISADALEGDGTQVSLRYDADRSETTIVRLSPAGERTVYVFYANGRLKSDEHFMQSGAYDFSAYYPDGKLKLSEYLSADGTRTLSVYREDGKMERYEELDTEGRLTVMKYRENGSLDTVDVTGPGSYVRHEDYTEEGRLAKSLATDPATGLYALEEYYPSGGKRFVEKRDNAPSYCLEEYLENGLQWHIVLEEPDGNKYTRITDEQGKILKEEFIEPSGLYTLREILEDGRIHEYQVREEEDFLVESYGIPDENGNIFYTYSCHREGDDFLLLMEVQEDGSTRTELSNQGSYQLEVTYPDGTIRHRETKPDGGPSSTYDYLPDGSVSFIEYVYQDGSFSTKKFDENGGWHEVYTDGNGVEAYVLDVRADGSWNSVRRGGFHENDVKTEEYVPGQYYRYEFEYFMGCACHQSFRYDASGHVHLETVAEGDPHVASDPEQNYDGPASGLYGPDSSLEDYSHCYESIG